MIKLLKVTECRYLRSIKDLKTLDLINKVIRNVVRESKDPKYRKLRMSNKIINAKIANVEGALDALFGKKYYIKSLPPLPVLTHIWIHRIYS